jgi:hypothetical protein
VKASVLLPFQDHGGRTLATREAGMESGTGHTPGGSRSARSVSPVRRRLLQGAGLAGAVGIAGALLHNTDAVAQTDTNDKVFSPLDYGATGDGTTPDDTAIADTIAAIPKAGGILDLSSAPTAYAITQPIAIPAGVTVIGSFNLLNSDSGSTAVQPDVICLSTFSGIAAIADTGALGTGDPVACTVSSGTGGAAKFTVTNSFTANQPVSITATTAPSNFQVADVYFVAASPAPTTSAFYLALTNGGAAVAFGASAGAGVEVGTAPATEPLTVRGVSLDMYAVPSQSPAPDGIRLMAIRGQAEENYVRGGPNTGVGIRFTDQNAGGYTCANIYEPVARFNTVASFAGDGIRVDRNGNGSHITDWSILFNLMKMSATGLGDPFSSTGAGINAQNSADGRIIGNHVYRCPNDAIVANYAWTAYICENKVDNFGVGNTGTARGIYVSNLGPPFSTIADNEVDIASANATATSVLNCYQIDNQGSNPANVSMSNNGVRAVGTLTTGATINVLALNVNAGTGGLVVRDVNFTVTANNGVTVPAAAAYLPNPATVTLLRGPLPAAKFFAPAQPQGTSKNAAVMAGLNCTYTPTLTGNVRMRITGAAGNTGNNGANVSTTVGGQYGTTAVPTNGEAATTAAGTAFSQGNLAIRPATTATVGTSGFALEHVATGLTVGTPIWVDVAFFSGTNGTAELSGLAVTIEEIN